MAYFTPRCQRLTDPAEPVRAGFLPSNSAWDALATATVLRVDGYRRLAVHLDYAEGFGEAAAFLQMRILGASDAEPGAASFRDLTASVANVIIVGGIRVRADVEIVTFTARPVLNLVVELVIPPVRFLVLLFREMAVVQFLGTITAYVSAD